MSLTAGSLPRPKEPGYRPRTRFHAENLVDASAPTSGPFEWGARLLLSARWPLGRWDEGLALGDHPGEARRRSTDCTLTAGEPILSESMTQLPGSPSRVGTTKKQSP